MSLATLGIHNERDHVCMGEVTPWRTLYVHLKLEPRGGVTGWSERLRLYSNGDFVAVIANEQIVIKDRNGQIVDVFAFSEFATVKVYKCFVLTDGHLVLDSLTDSLKARYSDQFQKASKGERPEFVDNSTYAKVSPERAGQTLVRIEENRWNAVPFKIYTLTGEEVPFDLGALLSE